MPGNLFGTAFRVATWGESHGETVGVVIDGCPPGLPLAAEDIQQHLDRRRPGQSRLTTQRREPDRIRIMSGVFQGKTLGTPIAMMVENQDARPSDYEEMADVYRPSHADMTYDFKYSFRHWMGGGRASARETVARVAAGAVAQKWLSLEYRVEIVAWVRQVGSLVAGDIDPESVSREHVDATPVRCPDLEAAARMAELIDRIRKERDSLGGVVEVVARNCPAGWGEPVFDKLDARLAHQYMSLPACKGVEVGSGFRGLALTGSQHNDEFFMTGGEIRTRTNHSGGIQGGISNGMPIVCRLAFKPTATVNKPQRTVDAFGREVSLAAKGRHDPCVLPRAVPIVEAVTALVLMDLALQDRGQMGPRKTDLRPLKPWLGKISCNPSAGAPHSGACPAFNDLPTHPHISTCSGAATNGNTVCILFDWTPPIGRRNCKMPTSMMLWILFGVGGLIIGFLIGYLFFGRSAHVSRRELENLRNLAEQRRTELAAANQRLDFLQEALEDKTIRERRAMETLQRALQADEEEYSSKDPKLRPM